MLLLGKVYNLLIPIILIGLYKLFFNDTKKFSLLKFSFFLLFSYKINFHLNLVIILRKCLTK